MTPQPDFFVRRPAPITTSKVPLTANMQQDQQTSVEQLAEPTPPIGETPPAELAREAADGRRGAAWRLMLWIIANDRRAMIAVSSFNDDRLAQHLLEFMALGTWAGKSFVVPVPLRSAYARTRLRTLFMRGAGIDHERVKRVLLQALYDPRPRMRESAAYLYTMIGELQDAPVLIELLQDKDRSVRLQLVKALGHTRSPDAIPALIAMLPDVDERLGNVIFHSLTQIGNAAVPALINLSTSSRVWVRWNCVHALGEIADNRALSTLILALNDPDHGVAWMAAKELVKFGRLNVEPVLRVLMLKDTSPWLVETCCYVLHEDIQRYAQLKPYLEPVIRDMRSMVFNITTPNSARKALDQLESRGLLHGPG